MCGINSIYRLDRGIPETSGIRRMCSAIEHRGPDGAGFARMGGGAALLGHVRLSIIDLAAGAQPIFNEDHSVGIVFNGEIYDYAAHRERLIRAGHVFRTRSDTEVIVHLYEEHGIKFLDHLNGEFAIVIFDENKQQLIAARDRMGVKPLYYSILGKELLISSEAKGILALERSPRELAPDYLTGSLLGAFPDGCSPFRGIRSLRPGHYMIADRRGVSREEPYWRAAFDIDKTLSFDDAKARVHELFRAAIKRRMVADVPVGTYLSGGVDSSLVCALMSELASGQPFKAFNVGFGDPRYDESSLARKIASHFGARFETIHCSESAMADEYERTLYHVEMPLVNPSAIAKQMLSRLVRSQGYKVCITGEGSDEIFGGYPYFKQEAIWRAILGHGDAAETGIPPRELWKRFTFEEKNTEGPLWHRGDPGPSESWWFGYPSFHQMRLADVDGRVKRILMPEVLRSTSERRPSAFFLKNFDRTLMRKLHPFNATKLIAFSQIANYIIPTLGDRVEMANSIECRTPFLDRDLVDFACTVPPEHFLNLPALREKYLLRQAFQGTLPEFLHKERKKPFLGASWRTFVATPRGRELFGDYCSLSAIRRAGYFKPFLVAEVKALWPLLPQSSVLWKKIDLLLGSMMGAQVLHQLFVQERVRASDDFAIEDRTPTLETREGARPGLVEAKRIRRRPEARGEPRSPL